MTALIVPPARILADIARTDPDLAVQLYAHRRVAGTHYGYNWHHQTRTDVCSACQMAERQYRRPMQRGPEYARLLAAGVNPGTARYLARMTHGRQSRRGRSLSTPVGGAVHGATVTAA